MIAIISKYRSIFTYGIALAGLLFLFRWLELRFLFFDNATEIYLSGIALLFTGLGIWLALNLTNHRIKTVTVEKEVYIRVPADFLLDEAALTESGISQRELEVLQLMSEGLSNQEIADRLFVSLNTVKTHASGLFSKLGVKRRIQAVEMAKKLKIISS
jgi:NarL family two-component system response regulator LiaR